MKTLRGHRSQNKTRRGGGKKENAAAAVELKVDKYINHQLELLQNVGDAAAGLFTGYNESYYKSFGLASAKKEALKAFKAIEKAEVLAKKSKYYNKNA